VIGWQSPRRSPPFQHDQGLAGGAGEVDGSVGIVTQAPLPPTGLRTAAAHLEQLLPHRTAERAIELIADELGITTGAPTS
jgi:hypothetical protein